MKTHTLASFVVVLPLQTPDVSLSVPAGELGTDSRDEGYPGHPAACHEQQ